MRSVHTLMHGIVDYAGLFPPAGLDLSTAVANYAAYRAGSSCWALGRFVVPAARLGEFERAAEPYLPAEGQPWRLAALGGSDLAADLAAIHQFNDRRGDAAVVDTIEFKAATRAEIRAALAAIDGRLDAYVELPITSDPGELVAELVSAGARAKVRTGGITPEAFPKADDLFRFILRCTDAGAPFKATAGLHHPLRGSYRLTYAPESPCATMYGFLNVFLTAAAVSHTVPDSIARALLEESSADALRFDEEGVSYRGARIEDAQIRHTRRYHAIAFGSCSFTEPIDDLRALGLL
ncbi:MAG TPA: hypothetical protein VFS33_07345 [Gemmatimonadales bacterium]|nr:hypothetical protein [Gemmatimonadales bacterium]